MIRLYRQALLVLGFLSLSSAAACSARADVNADRLAVATTLAQQISKAQLRKIYVADFIDSTSTLYGNGQRTDKGCYFSSVFSTNLTAQKNGYEVLNRIDTEKVLTRAQIDVSDLSKDDMFAKIAKASGADGILWGTFKQQETGPMTLELSLRRADSGQELFHAHYQEVSTDPFEALFPAVTNDQGNGFYFPGLDGVNQAACAQCAPVAMPDSAKAKQVQGTMILSAVFTREGALDETRVVHSLDPGLDQVVIEAINKWKITPAQAGAGKNISLRQCIQLKFDGSSPSVTAQISQTANGPS